MKELVVAGLCLLLLAVSGTGCKKSVEENLPVVLQNWRYPILARDGDTLGYFKVSEEANGFARITLEQLPFWMFIGGASYDVALYDGPLYSDIFSQLEQLNGGQQTWTTYPVKEYAGGRNVPAAEIIQQKGLTLKIVAPSEVVGIGTIR